MRTLPLLMLCIAGCHGQVGLVGPTGHDLSATIAANPDVAGGKTFLQIADIRCTAFEEEPTELECEFRAKASSGEWQRRSAILTREQGNWVLLSLQ